MKKIKTPFSFIDSLKSINLFFSSFIFFGMDFPSWFFIFDENYQAFLATLATGIIFIVLISLFKQYQDSENKVLHFTKQI